jgi:TrmH family RNA methyltransferase
VFHLPVIDELVALEAMAALAAHGCRLLAADGHAEQDLDDLLDAGGLAGSTAWIFGNEAHGLSPQVKARVDAAIRVPVYGRAESLNLAAAAAVCLYATRRAQRWSERMDSSGRVPPSERVGPSKR